MNKLIDTWWISSQFILITWIWMNLDSSDERLYQAPLIYMFSYATLL